MCQQTFSVKDQVENILCFASHTVSYSILLRKRESSHKLNVKEQVWLYSNKTVYENRLQVGFGPWALVCQHLRKTHFFMILYLSSANYSSQTGYVFLWKSPEKRTSLLPSTTLQHLPTLVFWEPRTSSRPMALVYLTYLYQPISIKLLVTLLESMSTAALTILGVDTL